MSRPSVSSDPIGGQVVVRLKGGLGNQLFQYATGRAVAQRVGLPLTLDLELLTRQQRSITPREYALGPWWPMARTLSPDESRRLRLPRSRASLWLARRGLWPSPMPYRFERGFDHDPSILALPRHQSLVLEGYWQSERNFADLRAELLEELRRLPRPSAAQNHDTPTVSVHVRRGDYVSNAAAAATHGVCDVDYYRRAFDIIEARIGRARYVVFTDDPKWVRDNETAFGRPLQHLSLDGALTAHQEMLLMSDCDHHVIANSSFSWWGAWLDPKPHAMVVAPQRWFVQGPMPRDLLPPHWQRT